MTLENKLLKKLAEAPPTGERHELIVSEGAWTAHLDFERRDEMSGRLREVCLRRQSAGTGNVQAWADRIAGRVTGLLEPLKVIEVDVPKDEALLRSTNPTEKNDEVFYYEVRLRGTSQATLQRYQHRQQSGKKRLQVPFALTHETLAKFAADVTAEK